MKYLLLILLVIAAGPASAETMTSAYTKFNVKKCKRLAKPDHTFEGTWKCKGVKGYDIVLSADDAREQVRFGATDKNNCAGQKTFSGFNSAVETVEWRMKGKVPIAAIQRWRVSADPEKPEKISTWLVVNKLDKGRSCHASYVAGSYPKANEVARNVADRAEGFDCAAGRPTFYSTVGAPGISLESCNVLMQP